MATVGPKKSRLSDKLSPAANSASAAKAASAPTLRRRRIWPWVVLGIVVLGIALAPMIAAHSPLRNLALRAAVPVNGSISTGSASFGWFSPVVVGNLEIRDAEGEPVIQVDSLSSEKSLFSLATNWTNLGNLHLTHPVVHVVMSDAGSNLEEVFAPLLQSKARPPKIAVKLEVVDGVVTIDDRTSQREYQLQDVAVHVSVNQGDGSPLEVEAVADMPTDAKAAQLEINLVATGRDVEGGSPMGAGKLNLQIDALPLDVLQPFLRRRLPGAELSGRLSSDMHCVWGEAGKTAVQGQTTVTDLYLAADALGRDQLQLDKIEIPCRIVENGDMIDIQRLLIDCDLGQIALVGQVPKDDFSATDLVGTLLRESYQVTGHLDLANLAAVLPDTLRIRKGTEIDSGKLQLSLKSEPQRKQSLWTGRLEATNLVAQSGGRKLTWKQPLVIDAAVHDAGHGLVVDDAQWQSSFLHVAASGTMDQLKATVDYDLARLRAELAQFIDLDDFQLAGQGQGRCQWKRVGDDGFTAEADFDANNFELKSGARRPWKEAKITAKLRAVGALDGQSLKNVESLTLDAVAGQERLQVELLAAVANPTAGPWPLRIDWQGEVADWLPRAESFVDLSQWQLAGVGRVHAEVAYAAGTVDVKDAKVELARFRAYGPNLFIDEPQLDLTATARYEAAKQHCDIPLATLKLGTAAARVENASWSQAGKEPAVAAGTAKVHGDLKQIGRWLQDPRQPPQWNMAGEIDGQAVLKQQGALCQANVDVTVERLEIVDLTERVSPPPRGARPAATAPAVWREKTAKLVADATYDSASGLVQIAAADLTSDSLRCQLAGKVLPAVGGKIDVQGKLHYDWEQLAPLWRPYLGADAELVGRESRTFALRGPWPAEDQTWIAALKGMTGEGGIGWERGDVFGVAIGPGDIAVKFAGGNMQINPIDVQVGAGRVTLAPQVRLSPEPAEMRLARGPLITKMKISPELCARGLKFIAPVLAEATIAEGEFSIDLDGARIPLADAEAADVAGHFVVHSVEVKPGPLADQFIALGRQIGALIKGKSDPGKGKVDTLVSIDNQNIEFRVVERRVYHRRMTFMAGDVPITTQGSVGMDESLTMLAEVTIQDDWIGDSSPLASLKGQTLQIPIEGTLSKPKLDSRALEKLTAQMVRGAAQGIITDQLNKQLEKLLPSGR